MNHEALTELARTVEKSFPSFSDIDTTKKSIDFMIRFSATNLPMVSNKSKPEEFMILDDLQKSIRHLAQLEIFLDQLQSAVFETE